MDVVEIRIAEDGEILVRGAAGDPQYYKKPRPPPGGGAGRLVPHR